jgi:hypothetical protein
MANGAPDVAALERGHEPLRETVRREGALVGGSSRDELRCF